MTVIYFWVISKHWFWIVLVGYVMQIISMILYWFLPESPAFLFSLNRVDETIQVFQRIAKMNKAREFAGESDRIRPQLSQSLDTISDKTDTPPTCYFLR